MANTPFKIATNKFSVASVVVVVGNILFCFTIAKFVVHGYDQVEMAINSGSTKIIVTAFFRSFCYVKNYPGETAVRYFYPSDAVSPFKQVVPMSSSKLYMILCFRAVQVVTPPVL